jgi:adenylosuccinate lyase
MRPADDNRVVIERYTRPELGTIWTDEARMQAWRRVEVAACEELPWLLAGGGEESIAATAPGPPVPAEAEPPGAGGPTTAELEAIRAARFTVAAVNERERTTDHDVAAFVDVLASAAGEAGRWIHYGLTSSDVLDTALALQLRAAGEIVVPGSYALVAALAARAREHTHTLCIGRTHGVHAEPTTFGVKLAGFAFEAHRNAQRLERAFAQVAVGAVSGAVGTYAATSPEFEARVLGRLGLAREPVSTQVVARDRHAELLGAIALAGAGLERLATEIRHLQRTEVREVQEPFRAGQKGSSAMPHKRNPIKSEQISGLARVLRGNAQAALENVALWHERDISHSSVERIVLADSTTLIDYLQQRAIALVGGMAVDALRMRANLELTHGALFSQALLLALVQSGRNAQGGVGLAREDAYRIVQRDAQRAWDTGAALRELIAAEPAAAELDLDAIFDYERYVRHAAEIVARLDAIA